MLQVASGSIGQIHKAILSERGALHTGVPPGTCVAVKVQRLNNRNPRAAGVVPVFDTSNIAHLELWLTQQAWLAHYVWAPKGSFAHHEHRLVLCWTWGVSDLLDVAHIYAVSDDCCPTHWHRCGIRVWATPSPAIST